MKQLDIKFIWPSILLFVIILLYYFFELHFLSFFKTLLESPITYWVLGAVSFVVSLIHFIKFNQGILKERISFSDFKNIFEILFNPSLLVTSISLAKGLFLQHFFNGKYFENFSELELGLLTFVVSYLLLISFIETWKLIKEAYKIPNPEKVTPKENEY